jgi:UDP-glucose 4-epimerase
MNKKIILAITILIIFSGTLYYWGKNKETKKTQILVTEKIIEKEIPVEVIPRRNIDLATPISNPKKAEKELGWKTKVALSESIENAYRFLKKKREQST